jgi:large subunit ribosomal protein L30
MVRATLDALKRSTTPPRWLPSAASRSKTCSTERCRLAAENSSMSDKKTLTVKLVKSVAGTRQSHRDTVRGLGPAQAQQPARLEDTPAVRGMINKVAYLVKVL